MRISVLELNRRVHFVAKEMTDYKQETHFFRG